MKKNRGFTLVEVIMALVIVTILAQLVVVTLGNMNIQLSRERKRTEHAFKEQGEMEKRIEAVEALIETKFDSLAVINDPTSTTTQIKEAKKNLNNAQKELDKYPSFEQSLNGQKIKIYQLETPRYNTQDVQSGVLTSWVVESKASVFPVPEIKKIEIAVKGEAVVSYGTWRDKQRMRSKVEYGKNKDKLFTEQYVWQLSRPGFHMIFPEKEAYKPPETYTSVRYPSFPKDYEFITKGTNSSPSETGKELSLITEDMKGRFISLGLRATTREGKISPEKGSNPYYVIGYPISVYALLDTSLISDFPTDLKMPLIRGVSNSSFFQRIIGNEIPKIEPHGELTGNVTYKGENFETYSRFVHFTPDSSYDFLLASPNKFPKDYTVFVVARQTAPSPGLPIFNGKARVTEGSRVGGAEFALGFDKFAYREKMGGTFRDTMIEGVGADDGKWHVLALSFTGRQLRVYLDKNTLHSASANYNFAGESNYLRFGKIVGVSGADMNVAEVIVSQSVKDDEIMAMQEYLCKKYGISP
ncbi:MAG: prepilin-type N-terminal cleavage/methylation domain-containing protein [Filifactor alocis]|nr:prepilin-type N-terminal cleavage/methylation domain-containing protein [Filifactor alocis]